MLHISGSDRWESRWECTVLPRPPYFSNSVARLRCAGLRSSEAIDSPRSEVLGCSSRAPDSFTESSGRCLQFKSSLRRLFQGHAAAGKKDATLESLKPKVGGPDQRSSPVRCPLPAQDISLFRDLLDDASWKGLDSLKTCVCHRSTLSRSKKCILTSRVSEKQEWMSSRRLSCLNRFRSSFWTHTANCDCCSRGWLVQEIRKLQPETSALWRLPWLSLGRQV